MSCVVLYMLENQTPAELLTVMCLLAITRGELLTLLSWESWDRRSNTMSFVVLVRSAVEDRVDKH